MRRYIYNIITRKPKEPLGFLIKILLILFSFLYYIAINLRKFLYKKGVFSSKKLNSPVVSIGNITWGGTGKTPLSDRICKYLKDNNKKPALLIRGYGSDEERLHVLNLKDIPVATGKNRYLNALSLEREDRADIFILDDGFQHLNLARKVDIITINANNPFGNGLLIPAGILREPLSSLSRADIALITKSDTVEKDTIDCIKNRILKANKNISIYEAIHNPVSLIDTFGNRVELEYVKDKKIAALSGLGDNNSFLSTLKKMGASIGLEVLYMDHHSYSENDLSNIIATAKEKNISTIITTQKDWVKIEELYSKLENPEVEFLVLKIEIKIKNEEDFLHRLHTLLSC